MIRARLRSGAALAPMAGVTKRSTRELALGFGAGYAVAEMLSAKGYLYSPMNRAAGSILKSAPSDRLTGLQLFGSEPELVGEAAARLSDAGFDFIDVNMGCPAPKIAKNGEGAALMRDPRLAARVLRAAVRASRLPVGVKIRSGWDAASVNAPEFAAMAEAEGVSLIVIHARTRDQYYAGRADWRVIRDVRAAVNIPVAGNGDVRSGADALRMIGETGCDGVMVGRGALGNPWVFQEIACALRSEPAPAPPSARERIELAIRHLGMEVEAEGERVAVPEMRKQIGWYLSGVRDGARYRERINRMASYEEVVAELRECLSINERAGP